MAEYLEDWYSEYTDAFFTFGFDSCSVWENEDNAGQVIAVCIMDYDEFSYLVNNYDTFTYLVRVAVEAWMNEVFAVLEAEYPDKEIVLGIVYEGSYEEYPLAFPSRAVSFNSETWQWDVFFNFYYASRGTGNLWQWGD